MYQDPQLRRAHGYFALALLFFVSSSLLLVVPILSFLVGLSSIGLFALAYVNYFQAPAYQGQRWRPAVSLALVVVSIALIGLTLVLQRQALEARDAAAIANALRLDMIVRLASLALEALAWMLLGFGSLPRAGGAAVRVRAFLAGALAAALLAAAVASVLVVPDFTSDVRGSLESEAGQRALAQNTSIEDAGAFVFNAAANATREYRLVLDLGDLLPRLLALGGFYLLWTAERELRPREESEGPKPPA